jgi:outer membrane lipoprotein LolB
MKWLGRHRAGPLLALCGMLLLGGCAPLQSKTPTAATHDSWQGRLSVKVATEPPQAFSANFALQGSAANGTLALTSVLGTRLADMRWSAGAATLETPHEMLRFNSVDAMVTHSVGTALPLTALFGWLQGSVGAAVGWGVDLQDFSAGRIRAWRLAPEAAAEIKIILDPG